jgi:hypothetical protein
MVHDNAETEPRKWRLPLRGFQAMYSERSHAPDADWTVAISKATRAGRKTGASNVTFQVKASDLAAPTSANAREARYIPWAIEPLMPSAFADRTLRWIGLKSPDTAA